MRVFPLLRFRDFRDFRDLGAAMATAGQDIPAATRAVNKIPKKAICSDWPAVTGYAGCAFLLATLSYCICSLHHRINCQATVCFLRSSSPSQDPSSANTASGLCLDTHGMVSRTHRSRRMASAELEMHTCTRATCAHTAGRRSNHAPACGSLSGTPSVAQAEPYPVLPDRIAPQSVAKTLFQMQAKLEPMTLEERGRTGLTSKATGNPFAFAERPATRTTLHPGPNLALPPFTGPMVL